MRVYGPSKRDHQGWAQSGLKVGVGRLLRLCGTSGSLPIGRWAKQGEILMLPEDRLTSSNSHPGKPTGSSPAPTQVPSTNLGPVSYTHLRAHETRHDLVCRLLLEK